MNLALVRVTETAGIRRFLYPLSVEVRLPSSIDPYSLGLSTDDGSAVPSQITPTEDARAGYYRLDFAISLAPLSSADLLLSNDARPAVIGDPLQVTEEGTYRSVQQRFATEFGPRGGILDVVYDGVRHLRDRSTITYNGEEADYLEGTGFAEGMPLSAWHISRLRYSSGVEAQADVAITACKSWTTVTYQTPAPRPADEVVFTLPLTVYSPTLTCDFGVGNGIYGKLQAGTADEVIWQTELGGSPHARWAVTTAGRLDYVGEATTGEQFLPQRWFHLIDSDRALAVAITKVPESCRTMTVALGCTGDVTIAFRLGEEVSGPAEFGVCYHFLNDIPAIAAATNPQSILLPPVVEVLPA